MNYCGDKCKMTDHYLQGYYIIREQSRECPNNKGKY